MIKTFRKRHDSLGRLVELKVSYGGKSVAYEVEGNLTECFAQNMDGGTGPEYDFYVGGLTSLDICKRVACPTFNK